ncbi:MAG: WD40 repeat domain-containing protein, partial [Cyanobacteria bacterium P01_A01_bin.80]
LACELAKLNLPYIIVWREPVPDIIAQTFIQYFLGSYAEGKSLFNSVRDARMKLLELTNTDETEIQIPGLNWLPIICKSTINEPPTWQDLGGLTGKLPDSPYKGLYPFTEEDSQYYFGREKFELQLLEAVKSKSLVPIVGASGSGKSSVVFAGLVPRLRKDGMQIVSFRPGNNPFDALAIALKNQISPVQEDNLSLSREGKETSLVQEDTLDLLRRGKGEGMEKGNRLEELELAVDFQKDEQALCRFIQKHIQEQIQQHIQERSNNNLPSQRFILIADQFEELYTLTPNSQQQPFLKLLLNAVKFLPNFSLVITLRADFYGHAISNRDFSDILQQGIYNSSPMNREELRAVIEQPAAKMKVELEPGLTDRLIDDLGNQSGRLPLLEFTLFQLWQKHDKWLLTHEAYREIGGLEKALAKYASGVIHPLSDENKQKAEQIFIQLISPGEGTEDTKRKATRSEVGEDNWDLVEELASKRLIVTGWDETTQQQTVEMIHEALIREWGMLRGWIKNNRRFRIWQERLQFTVVKWESKQRDREYLLTGGNLGEAEGWYFDEKYRDYLSKSQSEFIQQSLNKRDAEAEEKLRLEKRGIKWFSRAMFVTCLAASGVAGFNWVRADISATEQKLEDLIENSQTSFNLENYEEALFEAIKARELLDNTWRKNWIPNSVKQKIQILINQSTRLRSSIPKNTLKGHTSNVSSAVFSPDGKTIASASDDNTVKLWSAKNGKLLHTLEGHKSWVTKVTFSPDGKTIASASGDNTVKLWSVQDGKLLQSIEAHQNIVTSVVFSPDGNTIASASQDNTIKLWSAKNGKLLHTLKGHKSWVWSVVFSPDGKTIASASSDNTVKLWSAKNGKLLHSSKEHKSDVWSMEFSPDGNTIASASADSTVKLWSAQNGRLLHSLKGHKSDVMSVVFNPDGNSIASASTDKTVKLWSTKDGQLLHNLKGHEDEVYSVVFSPDGKTVASASWDKTAKLWSVQDGKSLHSFDGHKSEVTSVSFSPDGNTIATASDDNTVKLWDWNLDDLVERGCNYLTDYLINYPEKLEELTICQNRTMLSESASNLVKQGEELARDNQVKAAVEKFNKANQWNPKLDINPWEKVESISLVSEGMALAEKANFKAAVEKFKGAQQIDNNIDLNFQTEELEQNPEAVVKKIRAAFLVSEAIELAEKGDVKAAVEMFKGAQQFDTNIDLNPETQKLDNNAEIVATKLAVEYFISQGKELAEKGDVKAAVEMFKGAQQFDINVDLNPKTEKIDNNSEALAKEIVTESFVKKARKMAINDSLEAAEQNFKKAQKLNANIDLNPETQELDNNPEIAAQIIRAEFLVGEGIQQAKKGNLSAAIEKFKQAKQVYSNIDLNPKTDKLDSNPETVVNQIAV